ncbi:MULTISPECIES: hypothetical protein [unclassified Helicobacter]|uniref:hypothetical protein n=1 Tax=unclassified Helicobacter TaxID=2593540 RepID=UPI000CF173E5|nr:MULTISPECIES: hypothetical protein [unclassified Helicobacter]
MIEKISSLLQNISKISHTKEINNTLPILLQVLKKESKDIYLIKMGNMQTTTKSQKELLIGGKYLANVTKSSIGSILLSNLTPYPKLLDEIGNSPIKLTHHDLKKFLNKDYKIFLEEWKTFLLEHLSQAPTRENFLFLGNMLLSLQKEILTLIVNEDKKDNLLQIKKKKSRQELEFYALYPHLGSIDGLIYQKGQDLGLRLIVTFDSVKNLLEKNISSLDSFSQIDIFKTETIEPLFNFKDHLLDLRS